MAPGSPIVDESPKPDAIPADRWAPPHPLGTIIGYNFPIGAPDWTIPLRVGPFEDITPVSSGKLTDVGMVELGVVPYSDLAADRRIYLVKIDLTSKKDTVKGMLVSTTSNEKIVVDFRRIPQIVNPERTDSPYQVFRDLSVPTSGSSIYSDGVCFIVKTPADTTSPGPRNLTSSLSNGNGFQVRRVGVVVEYTPGQSITIQDRNGSQFPYTLIPSPVILPPHRVDELKVGAYVTVVAPNNVPGGKQRAVQIVVHGNVPEGFPPSETEYTRYCSTDTPGSPLSVRDNFISPYAYLQNQMSDAAQRFDLQDDVQLDQIVSTIEDSQRLIDCSNELTEEACGSDMTVAPLPLEDFLQKYNQMLGMLPLNAPMSIDIAVMKIHQPIQVSNGIIQPGDYRVGYWFDPSGVFYAATLTGFRQDDTPVINQQVPAVPAFWVNADGSMMDGANISACRLGDWCLIRQSSCG